MREREDLDGDTLYEKEKDRGSYPVGERERWREDWEGEKQEFAKSEVEKESRNDQWFSKCYY